MKTLVILAHPNYENSLANKAIIEALEKNDQITEIRNLSALYPDYKIDVRAEQESLLRADNVIFQYPFFWYHMPAILKLWFDDVFEYQFAHGSKGDKLKGKNFLASFTVGGPRGSYNALGYNHFKISEFTKPLEQTAYMAQMNYIEPIYEYGLVYIEGVYNKKEDVIERSKNQGKKILDRINSLNETTVGVVSTNIV